MSLQQAYRHHHGCWWYRHYDPYDMPSWCGTYSYAPAYDYSYDYGDYGPYVGFAFGPVYYGGYGYARRYGGQAGGFAGAHVGTFGGTRFVPQIGGANVSGTGAARFGGGFQGGIGGHIGGGGLRIH